MKMRAEYTCPLDLTHDIIKGKWKPIILWQLGKERSSLSNLKTNIKGISQKVLIEQLNELLEFGMIGKNQFEGYPLKVEYYLSLRGNKMLQAISVMQEIGIELMVEIGKENFLKEKGFL